MSVTVRIPSSMRAMAGGHSEIACTGGSVGRVMDEMESMYPGLKKSICDDRGQVRKFVAVFLNGEDIRTLKGLDSPVSDRDEVDIVVAVAGG